MDNSNPHLHDILEYVHVHIPVHVPCIDAYIHVLQYSSTRVPWYQALERIPGVQTTREPRVENPQDGRDQRRGDIIRVHKDGTTWVVDVGVMCPGTTRYVGEGAATVPGTAAVVYVGVKMDKYSDQPNFVPFIVEMGGR